MNPDAIDEEINFEELLSKLVSKLVWVSAEELEESTAKSVEPSGDCFYVRGPETLQ